MHRVKEGIVRLKVVTQYVPEAEEFIRLADIRLELVLWDDIIRSIWYGENIGQYENSPSLCVLLVRFIRKHLSCGERSTSKEITL